jgi:hypothetical protein
MTSKNSWLVNLGLSLVSGVTDMDSISAWGLQIQKVYMRFSVCRSEGDHIRAQPMALVGGDACCAERRCPEKFQKANRQDRACFFKAAGP